MPKMSRIRSNRRNDKELKDSKSAIPLGSITYSKWSGRFTWTAIIQGAIVALLTAMLAAFVATTGYPSLLVQTMLLVINVAAPGHEVISLQNKGFSDSLPI
jgi:hypothetical protein